MDLTEKTVNKNYLYKGKILNLRKDDILLPNGKSAIREIVEHSGGCAVLCEEGGKFLFVKQFRYPYKEIVTEIPAGKKNPNESPEETAKRELEEECGYKAERLDLMFKVYPSPGYTEEIIWVFKASGLKKTEMRLDEDEFLNCEWIDKKTVKQMIDNGEIKDAKTLIALLAVLK